MNTETIKDLEYEFGKNGWGLVWKISLAIGAIILIPSVVALVGYGALGQQVNVNTKNVGSNEISIEGLKEKDSDRKAAQAAIIQNLKDINRRLIEVKQSINSIVIMQKRQPKDSRLNSP